MADTHGNWTPARRVRPIRAASAHDRFVARQFLNGTGGDLQRFSQLFGYFVDGFRRHAVAGYSRIHYPGMPSIRGVHITGLEGFARTAPLLAAWLHAGRSHSIDGFDIVQALRQGILNGTNPAISDYWGDIEDDDQRMVEAADVARTLWLSRNQVWHKLTAMERQQIATWLLQVNTSRIRVRNNWILFPDLVNAALNALGYAVATTYDNYWEFKTLHYREHGWFFDVPEGIDFYNCWGISYDLFWLNLMAPTLDPQFLAEVLTQSAHLTSHLIAPEGIPIMGRSACYRTAAPSPLIAAAHLPEGAALAGLARRAMDATWRYFLRHDVLTDGTLTMGYLGNDPRIIDDYTGAGSSHWGLRSLLLAFMFEDGSQFWQCTQQPLPVESRDYELVLPKLGWTVSGNADTGDIVITIAKNLRDVIPLEDMTWSMKLTQWWTQSPCRPRNHEAKYERRIYSAKRPFMCE